MRQNKTVRYFVVREFTAGCLPESNPVTLHSVSELREHLRDVRDEHHDEPYTVHTPVNQVVTLKPGESAVYFQTDRLWTIEVEAVLAIVRPSYPEQPAKAFSSDYSYVVNSQDLHALFEHHRAHIIGFCDEADVSAAYVLVGNGEYREVWVTTSSKPYSRDTGYTLVYGYAVQLNDKQPVIPAPDEKPRKDTYNGWANYPTWCVALWLDNEPATYHDARNLLNICGDEYEYANALKDYVEQLQELHETPTTGMFADLLGYALGRVDWDEIAENFADGYFAE